MIVLHKGCSVLLVAHSQYRGVYMGVARRLVEEHDARIHLYTATAQETDYYRRNYGDICATIATANELYKTCREPVGDADAVVAEARRNEAELGVTINELAVSDRHLGRGFALGGFGHPRSRTSEETTYPQMLNAYNAEIAFWRGEIGQNKPVLVLNAGKVLCVLARARDVPVRILAGSRYKNFYYWGVNEFLELSTPIEKNEIARGMEGASIEAPYAGYLTYRQRFDKQVGFARTLLQSARLTLQYAYWCLRGYEKAKGYYLRENVAYLWRRRSAAIRMTASNRPKLADLKGSRFVFFPLATEPETALQNLSPEYFSQLSCIASVCRDLPAGFMLIVKEHHTAIGRRPADFYDQIEEFKNVRIMHMDEPGFFVVKEAAAVVTITGTAGFEAAVLGKPVIVFGRHNIYSHLSNVFEVASESELKNCLSEALYKEWDSSENEGERFLSNLKEISFDLSSFSPWEPDTVGTREVEMTVRALLRGLNVSAGNAESLSATV